MVSPCQWSKRRLFVVAIQVLTFESLLLPLLLLRLDGVEDGGPDEKISESSDDQAEGPHVLLLHPTTTRKAPRPGRRRTTAATSRAATAAAAAVTGTLIPLTSAALLRSTRSSTATMAVSDTVRVGPEAE